MSETFSIGEILVEKRRGIMSVRSIELSLAKQNNRPQPREKIRGSQFVKREEKVRPKLTIRNPFNNWKKQTKFPK